ncbi:SGNH hydrolase [Trichoderma citrinoviride]|uniref:SGNH hydrolase n=1 Tax=Trichoderma citrinoviride TaxID=58853 RepID=A0A2T4AYX1_9HYPO|nr:SGNH hydrolase [Trichoderma citrinoviride]PTB62178.1 SGNH hydrolase [Trichoderma citrinoviride]
MAVDETTAPSALAIRRVTYDKILLFGDSLTELSSDIHTLSFALTPALQHYYFRKLAVVARGYGGYSSIHLKHVLLPTLRAETAAGEKIKLLVIEVGTNDAADRDIQTVPVETYRENLEWIMQQADKFGVERVIVVGPGPVDEDMLEPPVYNRVMKNLEYSEAAKHAAARYGVPFIDMWHTMMAHVGWKKGEPVPGVSGHGGTAFRELLTDGIHLTGKGYKIWYDQLLAVIQMDFPELRTEALPTNLPDTLWQEVAVKEQTDDGLCI